MPGGTRYFVMGFFGRALFFLLLLLLLFFIGNEMDFCARAQVY